MQLSSSSVGRLLWRQKSRGLLFIMECLPHCTSIRRFTSRSSQPTTVTIVVLWIQHNFSIWKLFEQKIKIFFIQDILSCQILFDFLFKMETYGWHDWYLIISPIFSSKKWCRKYEATFRLRFCCLGAAVMSPVWVRVERPVQCSGNGANQIIFS